jgi:hypothetical protein
MAMGTDWFTSKHSFSNGNCVQARWRKSRRSNPSGNCAEVRTAGGQVEVRDSKDPGGPVLRFSAAEWRAFIASV